MSRQSRYSHQSDQDGGQRSHEINRVVVFLLAAAAALNLGGPSLCGQANSAPEHPTAGKRLTVAILWFEDRTDDPDLAHGCYTVPGLLSRQLGKVKAIRILSPGAVDYAFRHVDLDAGERVEPDQARRMGELIEAQRVVWGSYSITGNQRCVDASVTNVATGRVSAKLSAAGTDWFDLRDSLNQQILAELNIKPTDEERRKIAERWTSSAEALAWYGKAFMFQQESRPFLEQEECLRKAVTADPNCAYAYIRLASTLGTQGRFGPAEDAIRRALQLAPDEADAHRVLGWLSLAQEQLDQAKAALRRACRLDPDKATHLAALAQVCALEGKWDEATALLEMAMPLNRTDAAIRAALARAYVVQRDRDRAMEEVKEAVRLTPEGIHAANALQMIGEVYELLGRSSEAIAYYERVVALAKDLAANPSAVRLLEQRIERLTAALTPEFVDVPMPRHYTDQTLDQALRDKLTEAERERLVNPLSWNEQMRQWAQELTKDAASDLDKAKAIFAALTERIGAQGRPAARTAQDVFQAWNNPEIPLLCGDQAVLFVALARAVDVNAFFVCVTRDPHDQVVNHACAAIFTAKGALLVDPARRWFGVPHKTYTVVDDLQTMAFYCFCQHAGATGIPFCRVGLKLWPDSLRGRLSLVAALQGARRWEESRRLLENMGEPKAMDWEAAGYWLLQGRLALHERNLERAKERLLKAAAIYPDEPTTYLHLGLIYETQRQFGEARRAFRTCLRNRPHPVNADLARQRIARINEEIGSDSPGSLLPAENIAR